MRKIYSAIIFLLLLALPGYAEEHPHILVNESDKATVLQKIDSEPWAKMIFGRTKDHLDPYVIRHESDPGWILDRYLMNRIPGKRYTHFISDKSGTELIAYEGDAPVPTVRVSPHKRGPLTQNGKRYIMPEIEDLIPNDTSMTMMLLNPETNKYDKVDPKSYVGDINRKINVLAYEASVIYWLTNDERYARFAADILYQWAQGAQYQEPITGPGRTGFLDIQTLGDESEKPLILAYDFLYGYLKKNGFEMSCFQKVFEKIAWTLSFRGFAGNNWFAAESSTLVAAALSLSDASKKDYYLEFFLDRDTVVNSCGQTSIATASKIWFTPDGHWKEPGGYHNFPTSRLLEASLMMEKNGYNIFQRYPILFEASYAMLKYSFPDLTASSFGDTGRPSQSMACLETAILMAVKYDMPILPDLLNAASIMEKAGKFDRSKNDITGLLCYLPKLPEQKGTSNILWHRTEKLDFASCYLQRNSMDKDNGLMCVVQGGTYNHNHANGMSMELYGRGTVQGIDPGNGPNYEHPMHVRYYTQWAAHNTVVADMSSTSTSRFSGGGGSKNIGHIDLVSMEPSPGKEALSDDFSYTLTKYFDASTGTHQSRLLSIIRTDEEHGFYVDIYRSDNAKSNDYLYHNIGDSLEVQDKNGNILNFGDVPSYPHTDADPPGLSFFKSVRKASVQEGTIKATFYSHIPETGNCKMNMWIPSSEDASIFTAKSPSAKTAISPYNRLPSLVVAIRKEAPADANPFEVIFEPESEKSGSAIESVDPVKPKNNNTSAMEVKTKSGDSYLILSSKDEGIASANDIDCLADFAVFARKNGQRIIYLGNGRLAEDKNFKIEAQAKGNIFIEYDKSFMSVRSSCPLKIKLKKDRHRSVISLDKGENIIRITI